jgi:hypothetical protein
VPNLQVVAYAELLLDVLNCSLVHQLSLVEQCNLVRELLSLVQVLGGHHDASTFLETPDQLPNLFPHHSIQSGAWLVKDDDGAVRRGR